MLIKRRSHWGRQVTRTRTDRRAPSTACRIVDLTQMLAGPFCTMLLADQGAEIIKVEPLDGDHTRIIGPYHVDDKLRAFGGYFASVNRNKKSIAIDLKTARRPRAGPASCATAPMRWSRTIAAA